MTSHPFCIIAPSWICKLDILQSDWSRAGHVIFSCNLIGYRPYKPPLLLLFSRKFAKVVRDANRYKMVDIRAPSINTKTSLLKSAKASSLFFFLYICVGGIGKLFKPETRIFRLILNSRCVFKNHQYFIILKSNFEAFFQDTFFPMRYNAKSREINVVISGNVLLFKDIKITLGLLITAREMHALFRENRFLEMSTTANNRITVSAVEPKIPSKS